MIGRNGPIARRLAMVDIGLEPGTYPQLLMIVANQQQVMRQNQIPATMVPNALMTKTANYLSGVPGANAVKLVAVSGKGIALSLSMVQAMENFAASQRMPPVFHRFALVRP
jgi:hypothetical protein